MTDLQTTCTQPQQLYACVMQMKNAGNGPVSVFAGERLLACFSPQPRLWTGAIAGDWVKPRNKATEWMTPPASSVLSTMLWVLYSHP